MSGFSQAPPDYASVVPEAKQYGTYAPDTGSVPAYSELSAPSTEVPQPPQIGHQQQPYVSGYAPPLGPGGSPLPLDGAGRLGADGRPLNMSPAAVKFRADCQIEWRRLMLIGLCDIDDADMCIKACFCLPCTAGRTFARSDQGTCCIGCLLWPLLCGFSRSTIQQKLGVPDHGPCIGCLVHICCPCCAVAVEARAVNAWVEAGKPAPNAPLYPTPHALNM